MRRYLRSACEEHGDSKCKERALGKRPASKELDYFVHGAVENLQKVLKQKTRQNAQRNVREFRCGVPPYLVSEG